MEGVPSSASPPRRTPGAARAPSDTICAVTACLVKVTSDEWMDGEAVLPLSGALTWSFLALGVDSFLIYSIHEGVRGVALDPNDNSEALMPISGTLFAVGVDFHAGMIPSSTQGFPSLNIKRILSVRRAP